MCTFRLWCRITQRSNASRFFLFVPEATKQQVPARMKLPKAECYASTSNALSPRKLKLGSHSGSAETERIWGNARRMFRMATCHNLPVGTSLSKPSTLLSIRTDASSAFPRVCQPWPVRVQD